MIAELIYCSTFANLNRGVEQLVARWAHNPKVAGSSPVPATKTIKRLYYMQCNRFFIYDQVSSSFPFGILHLKEHLNP